MKIFPTALFGPKYAAFAGRAARAEYLHFILFVFVVIIGLPLIGQAFDAGVRFLHIDYVMVPPEVLANTRMPFRVLYYLFSIVVFLPILSVHVRRLHDWGRSGWYIFPYVVLIGFLWDPIDDPTGVLSDKKIADFLNLITIVCFASIPGSPRPNKYGPAC